MTIKKDCKNYVKVTDLASLNVYSADAHMWQKIQALIRRRVNARRLIRADYFCPSVSRVFLDDVTNIVQDYNEDMSPLFAQLVLISVRTRVIFFLRVQCFDLSSPHQPRWFSCRASAWWTGGPGLDSLSLAIPKTFKIVVHLRCDSLSNCFARSHFTHCAQKLYSA